MAADAARDGLNGIRIGIQGFGLVGAGSAFRLESRGGHVVALADAEGTVKGDNLPLQSLISAGRKARKIDRSVLSSNVRTGPPEDILTADVDVLILAAGSHIVDADKAARINAQLVVEGANFALTDGGRETLQRRGIAVVPDVIASSSSAALVATQMASGNALGPLRCWEKIEASIAEATRRAMKRANALGTHVRQAYLEGIS